MILMPSSPKSGADFGRLDVLVHSIAFADKDYLKEGRFTETREMSSRKPVTSPRLPKLPCRTRTADDQRWIDFVIVVLRC